MAGSAAFEPVRRMAAHGPTVDQANEASANHRPHSRRTRRPLRPSQVSVAPAAPPGTGKPLDGALRSDLESRFDADLSQVRLHTGPAAGRSAAGIGARAYTLGSEIVLSAGSDPETLLHEITHVVKPGTAAGTPIGNGLAVSDPSDAFEREAAANARHMMGGGRSLVTGGAPSRTGRLIQRQIGLGAQDGTEVIEKATGETYLAYWNEKYKAYDLYSEGTYIMQVSPYENGYFLASDQEMRDEDAAVVVDGRTAIEDLIAYLKGTMSKDSNYCVAELDNGDLIISKVNGLAAGGGKMPALEEYIRSKRIEVGRDIHLAQAYNTSVGSNHAEMCIYAAAKQLGNDIVVIKCTGANCPYCAAVLEHDKIPSLNAGEKGRYQQGWAHPTLAISWGTQGKGTLEEQVEDLKQVLRGEEPEYGIKTLAESEGRSFVWLEGRI
jgi:hypothetical protein